MKKYSPKVIKQEAQLYLSGKTIPAIAIELGIPISTVSWHLIHPLSKIDYRAWIAIRYRLLHRAKNARRRDYEEFMIESSGLSELLYHQWDAIDEERRKTR